MVKKPDAAAEQVADSTSAPVSNQDPHVQNQDATPAHQTPPVVIGDTKPYLTTRASAEYGGQGLFRDLTDAELRAAPDGLFVTPTADQLALRRY
jgi:hypothetical protein